MPKEIPYFVSFNNLLRYWRRSCPVLFSGCSFVASRKCLSSLFFSRQLSHSMARLNVQHSTLNFQLWTGEGRNERPTSNAQHPTSNGGRDERPTSNAQRPTSNGMNVNDKHWIQKQMNERKYPDWVYFKYEKCSTRKISRNLMAREDQDKFKMASSSFATIFVVNFIASFVASLIGNFAER